MVEATNGAGSPAGSCKVLVVDDNVDSAQSMSLLLGLEGYEVECAYDGEEALSRAASFRPQVVLLDLGLPRFSGYEVARRLRGEGGTEVDASMLLVAVSGYGRERDRQAAREAGFDLHLTKPADPDEVLRVLAERDKLRAATIAASQGLRSSGPSTASAAGSDGEPASGPSAARGSHPDAPVAGAAPNA